MYLRAAHPPRDRCEDFCPLLPTHGTIGFDKDDAGRQFVANFRKVAAEMGFRHEHMQAYHPLGCYKDWNDALLNKNQQN